jgi:hypothetical protein
MPRDLPARIVAAVLDRLALHPAIDESLRLLPADTRQVVKDHLAAIVQREITRDAIAAVEAASREDRPTAVTSRWWFSELDRRDVDPERAAIFVAEFVVWWHEAGREFYHWNAAEQDEGLIEFAHDAVKAIGGWRAARRTLRSHTQGAIDRAGDCAREGDVMRGQLRIDQMFAFIVRDDDGTEGIPAVYGPGGILMPLVGADMARVADLRAIVLRDVLLTGKRITLVKFSVRETLEVIER